MSPKGLHVSVCLLHKSVISVYNSRKIQTKKFFSKNRMVLNRPLPKRFFLVLFCNTIDIHLPKDYIQNNIYDKQNQPPKEKPFIPGIMAGCYCIGQAQH